MGYSPVITRLIEELARLPGIGSKTAERLAFYIVRSPETEVSGLVAAIEAVKRGIRPCSVCYSPGETDPCPICIDPRRERDVVCVVEEPKDLLSIEKVGSYRGLFHQNGLERFLLLPFRRGEPRFDESRQPACQPPNVRADHVVLGCRPHS